LDWGAPRMGSEQGAEPSPIPVNTDLRSPPSSAVTRLWAWSVNDGSNIRAFATAWCSMEYVSGAGLGRERALTDVSVDSSLSEKVEAQC
jgi:hypothetical protein